MTVMTAISIGSMALGAVASNSQSKAAASASRAANNAQLATSERGVKQAEQQWQHYQDHFMPAEREVAQRALDTDSKPNRDQAAMEAQAGVTSSYGGLRQQLARTPGLDPSGARYLDALTRLGTAEAAHGANAQTGALNATGAQAFAKKMDAAGLGKGLPGNSSLALQRASNTAQALSGQADDLQKSADDTAFGVGRAFGDLANSDTVQGGIKKMFG